MNTQTLAGTYGTISSVTPIDPDVLRLIGAGYEDADEWERSDVDRAIREFFGGPANDGYFPVESSARRSWKDGREATPSDGNRHHDSFHPDPRDNAGAINAIRTAYTDGGITITRGYDPVILAETGTPFAVGGWRGLTKELEVLHTDASAFEALAYQLQRFIVSSGVSGTLPTYYGVWVQEGESSDLWYFDVVTLHGDFHDAMRVGRERNQIAIYDGQFGTDVEV